MAKKIFVLFLLFACVRCLSAQLPALRVSENRRFLVDTQEKPFFWLADTGWEAFHRLNKNQAASYFKKRSEQGFTVIQAVVLAELDGLRTPNANGDLPFEDLDPTRPNEAYFLYIDTLVDLAAGYGLYVALLPTWGDKVFRDWWGTGPEIFNPGNAEVYGKWIGNRYKNRTNIIWVVGGDRDPRPGSQDAELWRAMATGIAAGVGGTDKALMTFHPQPKSSGSSSEWFHQDNWLDFNMLQTGHCRETPLWETVDADYKREPAKPVLNGEAIYEEMPVCFNAKDLGYASAYDVRKAAYLSVFAGAAGHTYGCGPVIFFGEKGGNIFADLHSWQEGLDLPGANQMKYLRALMESRPVLERIPDQKILTEETLCAPERIQATRGKDYAFIYSAFGRPVSIETGIISGEKLAAHWYDPRSGKSRFIGLLDNSGRHTFTPPLPESSPVPAHREDWVLVLDDAGKNYRMPAFASAPPQFETEIRAFERADSIEKPGKGRILLYGSSTMRLWKSFQQDLKDYPVVNRGFGGSQMSDAIYYFDRVVLPLEPSLILLYEGDNDLSNGQKSPEQVLEDFKTFMKLVEQKLPRTQVAIYSLRPSLAREKLMPRQRQLNAFLKQYCIEHPNNAFYIDAYELLLTPEGRPNPDYLDPDRLHLNANGYKVWAKVTRDFLKKR